MGNSPQQIQVDTVCYRACPQDLILLKKSGPIFLE